MNDAHRAMPVMKYANQSWVDAVDELAVEEPLEIRVRGRVISVTMRTPGNDAELAAGLLLTEGIIHSAADIVEIVPCNADRPEAANRIDVRLDATVHVDWPRLDRSGFTASSCGVCGKTSIAAIRQRVSPIKPGFVVESATLLALPEGMRSAQATFDRTGGLHAAGLFDAGGRLLVLREDIGRHNSVDKVIGHALLAGWTLDQCVLLVSGRAGFEIVQKALVAGIPILAGVSAPSSLAVELAEEGGQTLVGFLREGRMNVYAGGERVRACGGCRARDVLVVSQG